MLLTLREADEKGPPLAPPPPPPPPPRGDAADAAPTDEWWWNMLAKSLPPLTLPSPLPSPAEAALSKTAADDAGAGAAAADDEMPADWALRCGRNGGGATEADFEPPLLLLLPLLLGGPLSLRKLR
jgi:hypothetical protein